MSKKFGKFVQEVGQDIKKATYGKACVTMGHGTLSRGAEAGVTPSQMRSMFPDLKTFSDAKIQGFIEIGDGLVNGSIVIPSCIFSEPEWVKAKPE